MNRRKLTYVTLYKDGTWGVCYTYSEKRYETLCEGYKVSRSNNSSKAIKIKLGHYLLGNPQWTTPLWIKQTLWSTERMMDCLEDPHKYKRKGISRG